MNKVLLAAIDVNDKAGAAKVAERANAMAESEGRTLHVVCVVPGAGMSIVDSYLSEDHPKRMHDQSMQDLNALVAAHMPRVSEDRQHVVEGTIYDEILKIADKLHADTIIIGAHSPQLKDYLIGTNAARVARHATQSVFVVR